MYETSHPALLRPVSAASADGEARRPALQTERLIVTPFTPALAETTLTGRMHLGRALGVRVPDDWLREDEETLRMIAEMPQANPTARMIAEMPRADPAAGVYVRWGWWLILHRVERVLIGEVSFRESPDGTGTVEIGYGVVLAYRGHGYATEAAGAVVDWALRQPGVARVVASCLRDNVSSRRVLEKLGLWQVGTDGALLVWERRRRGGGRSSRVTPPARGRG